MVASACSDAAALEHVLLVLLDQPVAVADSTIPPFQACFLAAGVTNAADFVSVSPNTHGSVEFSINADGSDAHSKLNVIQIKKLRSLVDWFSQVTAPPTSCWFDLTEDAFRSWRASALAVPADAPAASTSISPVLEFLKIVKRRVSDYKPFKEDRFFISWQRHLKITARSHNVDNMIDLKHAPSTPGEIALLHEQQKFFFSVFEQTVLTPDGLLIIRKHSDAGDATAVYSDLVDRCRKSAAAELAANKLENDLIEFRMDASWTKPNSAFLLAWTAKSLDLDAVAPQPTGDHQKRVWFTRAVAPMGPSFPWLSPILMHLNDLPLALKAPLTSRPISLSSTITSWTLLRALIKLRSSSSLGLAVPMKPTSLPTLLLMKESLLRTCLLLLVEMGSAIPMSCLLKNGRQCSTHAHCCSCQDPC
jgi:hypothetical protein